MIKVLLNGCNGRMGQEVIKAINETDEIEILCGVDRTPGNNNFPVFTNIEEINLIPDVIIDFSIPEATFKILDFAKINKIPTVVATTGFSKEQLDLILEYSKEFPIFRSANMSYETNLMAKLVAELAQKLTESDIEIVETHHNQKIDSPSGTAILLADSINDSLNNEMYYEYNRHAKREKRNKKEIGIHSIRGGNEVGKHTVYFFGNNESFEITHTVNSRGVFANGSVKAAFFIVTKETGLYNMNDMF